MKIGIDGRLWSESGVGRYIRNLVLHLSKIDRENEYYLLLLKKNIDQNLPKNFHKVEADIPWYSFKEQRQIPKILDNLKLDLVHFPHFNVPIFFKGRFIVTIHDLIHQKFQMKRATTLNPFLYKIKQLGYKTTFNNALKKSKKILTVSDYVKNELILNWKIKDDKITVTKEAVEENFINLSKRLNQNAVKKTLDKFNIHPPFIFYIGNAHPHKNVEGLIKTFLNLRKKYQYLQLVLSGNDHYFWQRIKKEFVQKDIIYTGFVNDLELISLYKSAQVYVQSSFEEGFGIPLLEAMVCKCPVVSSNAGSLKEVGGDAAIYFNPNDLDEIQEKITEVLNGQKTREDLIGKGEKRVKEFSWDNLAKYTLKAYMDMARI